MKINVVIAGLLIGFLIGCSENKQETTVQSNQQSEQKQQESESTAAKVAQFDSASFPKDTCGEQPPANGKTGTLTFYPVFVNYSEDNLQAIKDNYCRDAFKKLREDNGKEAIQVSSFISKERADQFTEFLENKLGNVNAEVGKPKVRVAKKVTTIRNTDNNKSLSHPKSVGKTAKLTSEQIKQILSVKVKTEEGIMAPVKAALPTYLPPGFEVEKVEIINKFGGQRYEIYYQNSRNEKFRIAGGAPLQMGGDEMELKVVEIPSSVLKEIKLMYMDSAQISDGNSIEFSGKIDDNYYSFQTLHSDKSAHSITLQEAVKIAESFQYLNP